MLEMTAALLISAFLLVYLGLKYRYSYWKRKKIPHITSNVLDLEWYHSSEFDYSAKIYRCLKGHKFGGLYAKFAPKLMILDPELIRHVLVKDFDHFYIRGGVVFDKNEPITNHLGSASGRLWKNLRTKLTPTFTSGKMKFMFNLVDECAKELVEVIGKQMETNDVFDVNEFAVRYTIEVISSCAFGLKTRTLQDGGSLFRQMATKMFAGSFSARFVLVTMSAFPWLNKVLRFPLIERSVYDFFYRLIKDTISHRKANQVNRSDFLQILIDLKNEEKRKDEFVLTDELMTAQCFFFFAAGFETSSTVISVTLYELAANTDVQEKLRNEITEYLHKYDNKITYEMIKSMPYLDQVFLESMRKCPVVGVLNRICASRYKLPNTDVFVEEGTEVLISVAGLHSDPDYFPNPEKFDPDRFKKPSNYTSSHVYLPFGDGPRVCIGVRFARMSVKLALVYLLRDYKFEWCSMTPSNLKIRRLKIATTFVERVLLKCRKNESFCNVEGSSL